MNHGKWRIERQGKWVMVASDERGNEAARENEKSVGKRER